MTFKEYKKLQELQELQELEEKVTPDCGTGAGVIPKIGPWKGFQAVRTSHLDDPRNPPNPEQRDHNFDCDSFDEIVKAIFKKRPLGIQDGRYIIFWKNKKGIQSAIINIDNKEKKIIFVTIMQLSKRNQNDYKTGGAIRMDLGKIDEPEG